MERDPSFFFMEKFFFTFCVCVRSNALFVDDIFVCGRGLLWIIEAVGVNLEQFEDCNDRRKNARILITCIMV